MARSTWLGYSCGRGSRIGADGQLPGSHHWRWPQRMRAGGGFGGPQVECSFLRTHLAVQRRRPQHRCRQHRRQQTIPTRGSSRQHWRVQHHLLLLRWQLRTLPAMLALLPGGPLLVLQQVGRAVHVQLGGPHLHRVVGRHDEAGQAVGGIIGPLPGWPIPLIARVAVESGPRSQEATFQLPLLPHWH